MLGGGQIGYNWQYQETIFGIEADIQATGQKHTTQILVGGATGSETNSIPWFGTVRARVGYAGTGFMAYATAGLAYGVFKSTASVGGTSV